MEPGVREYLLRIVNTLSVGLFWLAINSTAGIMYDHAFFHGSITTGNIIFYCWFIVSFILFFRWLLKLWSKPIDFEK